MNIDYVKEKLQIYKVPDWELIRMGGYKDGGYVLYKELIEMSDILYGYGVGPTTEFEVEYCEMTNNKAIAFDHTVRKLPHTHENITFVKEGIAPAPFKKLNTYKSHKKQFGGKKIFLKMDVEGWEFPVFENLLKEDIEDIVGIVIEIHDLDKKISNLFEILESALSDFAIYHIHPNNFGKTFNIDGHEFPAVIELSLVNKKYCDKIEKISPNYPMELDVKNSKRKKDIPISFLYEETIKIRKIHED